MEFERAAHRFGWCGRHDPITSSPFTHECLMADEEEIDTEAVAAAVRDPGSLRQRIGRARFRGQVRSGLTAELEKRVSKPAGVKRFGFAKADVPKMMEVVTDTDIDAEADALHAAEAQATPAAEGDAEAKGLRDWLGDNKELIGAVIAALLKKFLGI